jgi:hypothetical protein
MTYAGTLSAPSAVKAKMFGWIKRSAVESAIKEARQDFYASNVEVLAPDSPLSLELIEIAKQAGASHRPEVRQSVVHDALTDG